MSEIRGFFTGFRMTDQKNNGKAQYRGPSLRSG
jgi:hypothetical protein